MLCSRRTYYLWSIVTLVSVLYWWERDERLEIGRREEKRLGGWSGKLLVQVPIKYLSLSSCTVWARLISRFLPLSFHSQFPLGYCDFCNTLQHPSWCLYFQQSLLSTFIYFFCPCSSFLSMPFESVVLQGMIAGATEATQCSQALPNRH